MTIYKITCPVCGKTHSTPTACKSYCSAQCKKRAEKKRYVKKQANERAKKIAVETLDS